MTNQTPIDPWGEKMRASLKGDSATYHALLSELAAGLRPIIRGILRRMGQNDADVEDIVQETLLAVHLKRGNWNPDLPFAPWLKAVARFKVIDWLRRRGFNNPVPIETLADLLPAPESGQAHAADTERLIARLNTRQQRIVRGIGLEGHSAAEMGRELGMAEGAVRVALHRALKELGRLYRGEGG